MRRSVATIALTAGLAASLLIFSAGPAAAGGCSGDATNSPDLRSRVGAGPFQGGGVYGDLDIDLGSFGPGANASVFTQWKNKEASPQTIRVRGFYRTAGNGIRVRLFVDGVNVTDRFQEDGVAGLKFENVAAGKRTPLVEIRFRNISPNESNYGGQALYGFYKGQSPCSFMYADVND
jgi:hypothetical protein